MFTPKIIYIILSIFFLSCSSLPKKALATQSKPNILWIYLEDVNGWFSCYGDKVIKTPNIDFLAKSGVKFTRFYTPAGVCSATRSAIITGMMQTSIGAHNHRSFRKGNKNILPKRIVPLPIQFRKAGYWTFNEGGKDDYNFSWSKEEFYDFVPKHRWGPKDFLAGLCLKGKQKGQPFFGQIQLGGGKLKRGKDLTKIISPKQVSVPPYYPDIPEVREEIAHHYNCLIKTDEQVGKIIKYLKNLGEYENTLIFMFSDHGMFLHRHKQFLYEGGINMPLIIAGKNIKKGVVRDDLISGIDISAASLIAAGIKNEFIEGRDFLAENYIPRKYIVAARDRCDYTIDKIRAIVTPKYKYLKNYLTDRPYMQANYKDKYPVTKALRKVMSSNKLTKAQLTFFGRERPEEELYDLINDPHEINNLAKNPKFTRELAKHRFYLKNWIKETGDQGQKEESIKSLREVLNRWQDKCTNPEFNKVKNNYKK